MNPKNYQESIALPPVLC